MAVSKRTRFEVLRRDNHTCRYCGASAPDVKLHVDHVTPVSLGGTDAPDNLVAACIDCNIGKSSSSPDATHVAQVSEDAVRWAAAIKQAAKIQRDHEFARIEFREAVEEYFEEHHWCAWSDTMGRPIPVPTDWIDSFVTFIENGIHYTMLAHWIDETATNGRVKRQDIFRYVCGIAWKKIREQQDLAKQLIEKEDAAK